MSAPEVLHADGWISFERRPDGTLRLSVLCGTVGLFVVAFDLDAEEAAAYGREGDPFIERLAREVVAHPHPFLARDRDAGPSEPGGSA